MSKIFNIYTQLSRISFPLYFLLFKKILTFFVYFLFIFVYRESYNQLLMHFSLFESWHAFQTVFMHSGNSIQNFMICVSSNSKKRIRLGKWFFLRKIQTCKLSMETIFSYSLVALPLFLIAFLTICAKRLPNATFHLKLFV